MFYVKAMLILIEIISSILLIVIILLQRSKSEGLGLAFGSQMGESLFGARAGNVLVKVTVWLGIIFLVNTTVLAKIYSQGSSSKSLISESSVPAPRARQVPFPAPVGQPVNQPLAPAMPMSVPVGVPTPAGAPNPSPVIPVSVPAATPAPAP